MMRSRHGVSADYGSSGALVMKGLVWRRWWWRWRWCYWGQVPVSSHTLTGLSINSGLPMTTGCNPPTFLPSWVHFEVASVFIQPLLFHFSAHVLVSTGGGACHRATLTLVLTSRLHANASSFTRASLAFLKGTGCVSSFSFH